MLIACFLDLFKHLERRRPSSAHILQSRSCDLFLLRLQIFLRLKIAEYLIKLVKLLTEMHLVIINLLLPFPPFRSIQLWIT